MDNTVEYIGVVDEVKVDGCTSATTLLIMLLEPEWERWIGYEFDEIEWTATRYSHQN